MNRGRCSPSLFTKYIVDPDGPEWSQWVSGSRGIQNRVRWKYAALKHPLRFRLSSVTGEISEEINEAMLLAEIGANNDYRKREIISVVLARLFTFALAFALA